MPENKHKNKGLVDFNTSRDSYLFQPLFSCPLVKVKSSKV